ncbi:C-24(28) sterol reductase [Ceratobasidium sp. 394]|nr:C-24(28) sterol reductase [Ceratobasidium sp. 394]KAG9099463.1 C-24(28) sterol reductase [Ceratobasidium sp. UAMH 11750]
MTKNGNGLCHRKPVASTIPSSVGKESDVRLDKHETYEFGGPVGVTAMIFDFPVLMYYLWACLWLYDGQLVHPS